MNKKNNLITFEIDKELGQLDFHLNKQGLDTIVKILIELSNKNENDHFHLLTPEWGGDLLSNEKQSDQSTLINSVKIHFWKENIEL